MAGQSNAGSCDMEMTDYHRRKKNNLWVKHLWPINPLEEPTLALLLQN
jgi:hypothetical protein